MRLVDPLKMDKEKMAGRLDKAVLAAISKAVKGGNWKPRSKEYRTAFLPCSMGGLGLKANEEFVEAAWLASCAESSVDIKEMLVPEAFQLQVKKYNVRVKSVKGKCQIDVPQTEAEKMNSVDEKRPKNWEEAFRRFVGLYGIIGKAQKRLSNVVRWGKVVELWGLLDKKEKVEIVAKAQPKTSLWMYRRWYGSIVEIQMGRPRLSNVQFSYLIRRWIGGEDPHGLRLMGDVDRTCGHTFAKGGCCNEKLDMKLRHAETNCKGVRGGARHTKLQNALMSILRSLGAYVSAARKLLGSEDRADVQADLLEDKTIVYDVTVRDARGDNVVNESDNAKVPCAFNQTKTQNHLERGEKQKNDKYKDRYSAEGDIFYPFVVGTWGGFGTITSQIITDLAGRLDGLVECSIGEAVERIKCHMQVAALGQMATNGMESIRRMKGRKVQQIREDQFARAGAN